MRLTPRQQCERTKFSFEKIVVVFCCRLLVKNSVLGCFVYDLCGQTALICDSAVKG